MKLQDYSTSSKHADTPNTIVERISEIARFSHIATTVMEVSNDPKSSAIDLKGVVQSDAALSAHILRYVNSSAFAMREKVSDLQQAISYLGFKQTCNLAITASVGELFGKDEQIGLYRRSKLWRHLVSVGICARMIAVQRGVSNYEDAFLAGLLHDIGIVLEDRHVNGAFRMVMLSLDGSRTLLEAERHYLGFDHTILGKRVAQVWGFSEAVQAAIRFHHTPAQYNGEHDQMVLCVEVANWMCTLKGIPSVRGALVELSQLALDGLSLTKEDIEALASDFSHELILHTDLLEEPRKT